MKIFYALAACFAMILATAGFGALAQQPDAAGISGAPLAIVPESEQQLDPAAVSGPPIYVVDNRGRLATINSGTFAVHVIGRTGTLLTDIGFQPGTHKLYGVSFRQFYSVNKTTGRATPIGRSGLGVSDANALVFNSHGEAFSAGFRSGELYKINVSTGRASVLGRMGGFKSAGDLVFYNGQFMLSGFKGCCDSNTTPNYLVALNERTGAVVRTPVLLSSHEIFGLVSTGRNKLIGLADIGTNSARPALYQFVPANSVGHRDILLKNLSTSGLGQIYGAAFDGNFQP